MQVSPLICLILLILSITVFLSVESLKFITSDCLKYLPDWPENCMIAIWVAPLLIQILPQTTELRQQNCDTELRHRTAAKVRQNLNLSLANFKTFNNCCNPFFDFFVIFSVNWWWTINDKSNILVWCCTGLRTDWFT